MALKVRFSVNDSEARSRRRRRRHRRTVSEIEVPVDIGLNDDFIVKLGSAVGHEVMHQSPNSLLLLTSYEDTDDKVVVIRWGVKGGTIKDKDHISSAIASNIVTVPIYESKKAFMIGGEYVSVGLRSYIPGLPLSAVIHSMDARTVNDIKHQVSSAVMSMSEKTSPNFGHLTDGGLRASTARGYLNHRITMERLRGNQHISHQSTILNGEGYRSVASLVHGNLKPEHIIIRDNQVAGFVGWSCSDFVPEQLDRLNHYFASVTASNRSSAVQNAYGDWMRFISSIPANMSTRPAPPSFVSAALYYTEALAMFCIDRSCVPHIQRLSRDLQSDPVEIIPALAVSEEECDTKSLSALTDETIDTWELSTIAADERARR